MAKVKVLGQVVDQRKGIYYFQTQEVTKSIPPQILTLMEQSSDMLQKYVKKKVGIGNKSRDFMDLKVEITFYK